MTTYLLALESSCDETAASVISFEQEGPPTLRSSLVASQVEIHARYGGVVPEIASRAHLEVALPLIQDALLEAGLQRKDLSAIAVTRGPGLIGALLVGLQIAKSIAFAWKLPLIGVNHLAGHLEAVFLEASYPSFPFLALLVSGGHTTIYRVDGHEQYKHLGSTRDDAAGEAFDKAAKMLGLGYPGGVYIDRLAQQGDARRFSFPRAMLKQGLDFSFSGLKTACRTELASLEQPLDDQTLADFCASYQEAIVDVLWQKVERALEQEGLDQLVLTGGVAANSRLRAFFQQRCDETQRKLFLPSKRFCTDNAAMIAAAAVTPFRQGRFESLDLNATGKLPLDPNALPRGPRRRKKN
ncbi:MAG: tRNA (adenosine(37)-N6)-threonylcarbamoyltransferase complex transferase subunit TsaD [Myxococcales bacterium]|nr:tRNA (adenosine(37)-N6)-threonylcarbamoyltransferase complex transferase subunit TsaD [Myxococcales bacterium]MCB9643557.1 tRNA (adenosine(37)-N6)-threonylcarbamoyltransferase complex transferase subunit TsaD [Myxococcales bacterium]